MFVCVLVIYYCDITNDVILTEITNVNFDEFI